MNFIGIFLTALALSMDSFATSITCGSSMKQFSYKRAMFIAFVMGFFQALMPVLGWFLGVQFEHYVTRFDHWIAFLLLAYIGSRMIYESMRKKEEKPANSLTTKRIVSLGIATSIDALAIGISFALLEMDILFPAIVIGITTVVASFSGVFIGYKFGKIEKINVELIGGIILILIGTKILIEHLMSHSL